MMHGPEGGQLTVKVAGELSLPPAETTTAVDPTGTFGTVATIAEADQELITAGADPNFTPPVVPWVAPKLAPLIVTAVPSGPFAGERVPMLGPGTS